MCVPGKLLEVIAETISEYLGKYKLLGKSLLKSEIIYSFRSSFRRPTSLCLGMIWFI